MTATNGIVISADLNNDGIMDFIFPGATLYTMMWNTTTNQFDVRTLYQNVAVDDMVWCYDFDHDGDLDLLATFSAAKNVTCYAYTCFFINDGNGNFTQQDELDYGTNKLWFSNLQDIDGDGYYDLLAFRGEATFSNRQGYFTSIPEVVWLQGLPNLSFAQPQLLFPTYTTYIGDGSIGQQIDGKTIEAEDLNNDGKVEVWASGLDNRGYEVRNNIIYQLPSAAVNAAPTAPAAPTLTFDNGYLTITWGNGSDDHTQVNDLTYDVRIGTASGAMDILRPHANADGSRRNFLDGAMGRKHSYTINLNSYLPGTIYVAVQAIDAQHVGSAWSAEATIAHEVTPVVFALDKDKIMYGGPVVATFTSLPEGYTHTWTAGDATITTISESQVSITWQTAGNKTITHTVTTPSGTTTSATETVSIFPIAFDSLVEINPIPYPMADYNYDGLLDGVVASSYRSGWFYAMTVYAGNGEDFSQAVGLWNTNILTSGAYVTTSASWSYMPDMQWRDWNKDGHVDLVFRERIGSNNNYTYAYLPHTSGNTLSRRVEDPDIAELFNYTYEQGYNDGHYVLDVDNNGYLDTLYNKKAWSDNYNHYAAYAVLMDENGVMAQDWLFPMENKDNLRSINYKGVHFFNGKVYLEIDNGELYPVITQADERPAAPTGLTATQTDDGLLISWNAAVDDHTPAASMRYNLSVKRSGMTGAGSYIISPQNNENDNAAYIPGYEYISGTQYLIPMSELYSGALEIRLQALDLQNKLSVFTDIVTVTILRDPIEVPSLVCGGEEVTISFQGDEMTATPVWDFDGATVVSGSGYGPYSVVWWYNWGEKTIRLTIDGQTYSRTLTVDGPGNLPIHMPGEMVKDVDYTISIPEGATFNGFWVEYNGSLRPIDNIGIVTNYGDQAAPGMSLPVAYNKCMSANGTTIRINSSTNFILSDPFYLYINITTENGCSGYLYSSVTIVESATPVLTLVTTDANGHNVVSWMNTTSFPKVRIYKEGNTLNQFDLIGEVYGSLSSYTDINSNSEQKAERYRISVLTTNGAETAMSDIHKTVHLTISRGVMDGTFNLIWNMYEGADVQAYTILRGETPTSLEVLAQVAASNTSFTDNAPVDSKPYYAIEYSLVPKSYAPQQGPARASANNELVGRSNVVNRASTALETMPTDAENATSKLFLNGHFYILRNGVLYTITGAKVRCKE